MRQRALPLITILLLLSFAVRVYRLDHHSVWWDESYSVDLAEQSLWEMTLATAGDIHPPLHYWLLHGWIKLTNRWEYAIRFHSLLFGMLLLPLVYQLARRLFPEQVARFSLLILSLAPFHITYSQEARMYTLESLLTTLSVYFLVLLLRRVQRPEAPPRTLSNWYLWVGWVLSTALSLWADYFPVFVIVFENIFVYAWGLVQLRRSAAVRGFLARWTLAQVAAAALYLPWLGIAYTQITGYGYGRITTPPFPRLISELWTAYNLGQSVDVEKVVSFLTLDTLIVLLGIVLLPRLRSHSQLQGFPLTSFLVLYLIVPIVVFLFTLQFRPFFNPRYLHAATPPLYLLMAVVLATAWERWRLATVVPGMALLVGFGVALNNYFFVPTYGKDDARALMTFLQEDLGPRDLVLWQSPHPFKYYYQGIAPAYHLETHPSTAAADLTRLAAHRERVFWVKWVHNDTDPWDLVNYLLLKSGTLEAQRTFSDYQVFRYSIPSQAFFSPGEFQETWVNFGNRIALRGVAYGALGRQDAVPSGERAWVSLRWQSLSPIAEELKFFVHLRDAKGRIVGQEDRLLWNEGWVRTPYWNVGDVTLGVTTPQVRPGTPPGEYALEVGVYAERAEAPLGIVEGSAPLLVGSLGVAPAATFPRPETLPMQYRGPTPLGELDLLGYSLGVSQPGGGFPHLEGDQGSQIPVTLFWRARAKPSRDHPMTLRLTREGGIALAEDRHHPADDTYPTGRWRQGEVVTDRREFLIPPQVPPGNYRLSLTVDGAPEVPLASVAVRGRERDFQVPPIPYPQVARLGESIEFLGYALGTPQQPLSGAPSPLRPADTLLLTLYWRAQGVSRSSYTVYTHLIDADFKIWGQKDSPPQGGASPTTSWVKGQVIADPYPITVAKEAPPGSYRLEVGMYDPVTGQRLPLAGGGDAILLETPVTVAR